MDDLIQRIEQATGPSRELDFDIMRAVDPRFNGILMHYDPKYTASIDAALTLVPAKAKVTIQNFGAPGPMVLVDPNTRFCAAPTIALAICIASLRARKESNG